MADSTTLAQSTNVSPDADSPASHVKTPQHEYTASIGPPSGLIGPGGKSSQLPGATVYTPTSTPSAELNPRSCVTCRRRKVRCDKLMPCSNCRRALIPCIFPAPERAPRRPRRKDPKAMPPQQSSERELQLLKRLRKLEGIVEDLSGQVELEATRQHSSKSGSPDTAGGSFGSGDVPGDTSGSRALGSGRNRPPPISGGIQPGSGGSPGRLVGGNNSSYGGLAAQTKDTQKQLGNLVINDYGRSRYVSSAFWSKINDELDELRAETQRISQGESDESDTESQLPNELEDRPAADHHAFIFGYQSGSVDLRSLHPLPSLIPYIWQVYQENVDPLVKILHIPTTSKLVRDVRTNLDNISPAAEALMFAIYYAAISSLDEHEAQTNFMATKEILVSKYRFALEQALAKAQFMVSSEIVTLQAFVLYLVLVRRHEDTRLAWTLTGLAVRICHSLGLHRDGSHFLTLKPFEVEMRRRLFWSLCILDMRSAEDQGTDLTIVDHGFDTKMPLNINDADISPESRLLPAGREGATDMTFSLIRFEICRAARRIHALHTDVGPSIPDTATSLEDRERIIREVYECVQNKYLKCVDTGANPMFWVAANIARCICAKMTLVVYQPVLLPSPGNESLPGDLRDRLFSAATELFEINNILTTDPRTRQWRWLFQSYTQWHAVAYIMIESAKRQWSASVERGWDALTKLISTLKSHDLQNMVSNSAVWLPFRMLYNKARRHREAEIQRMVDNPNEAIKLDHEDQGSLAPTPFFSLQERETQHDWRNKWLQLVGNPSVPPFRSEPSTTIQPTPVSSGQPSNPDTFTGQHQTDRHRSNQDSSLSTMDIESSSFLNHVFTKPIFQPSDLWPMAFSGDAAKGGVSNFGSFVNTDIPRQDDTLAAFATKPLSRTGPVNSSGDHGPASDTPLVDEMVKDNPPPWLWKSDGSNPSLQYDSALAYANVVSNDMDINMDDSFDWQDFGQTLGGLANGVWSSHGL